MGQRDYEIAVFDDVALQSGFTLPRVELAYKTYGELNAARDNVVVYPTWYSGQHPDNEWLIGPGRALDPADRFVIVPNMLGNGLSSSPSNTPEPFNQSRFPLVTVHDQVRLQHRLVTERLGIERVSLVTGWSMAAMQSFEWGAAYPDMVERIAPFCGTAKCWPHNHVFLEAVRAAIHTDAAWDDGWYTTKPHRALRAVGRVYAGWGVSQAFYRSELWRDLGFTSLEDFLVGYWEGFFLERDPNNLLAMAKTWQTGNVAANDRFHGDFEAALGSITARAIVMPGQTDLYFTPEDSEYETSLMPNAEFRPIPSVWGHFAGVGAHSTDTNFIDQALKDLLAR
ncbi:alpha/beta fold hydrolase [Spiractinospora alimapuensis]|uniref:alpha/beta fold hydrolase n=1 Tax=Spiractinospora alimapuensis TaxID=2820884 RepID=UPI001F3038EC|nr:alpha/beta fold hydrolase [Spiractinospora alimapuensis]QVQ54563.1 alpha/beta fold hydrolase [Spiractinospora alimapuensis]